MTTSFSVSFVLYLLAGMLVLGGCESNRPSAARAIAQAYPAEAEFGPDLDVVAVRDGRDLQLVNREARTFRGGQLWLNGQYMREIDRIDIGTENRAPLREFRNRFGEHFPLGSFLRPERSRPLVLAELYDPAAKVRQRLTVQPPPRSRHD